MSANVELVRAIYAAWERGDWGDAWWASPQIEFAIADGPDQRTIAGVEEMARTWAQFLGAWADYAISGEEFRALDEERVLALLNATGRGKASGVDIGDGGNRGANIFTIRDGAVTRLAIYFDYRNALAELGLDG